MTFQYNGEDISVVEQNATTATAVRKSGVTGKLLQKPLRILVVAVIVIAVLYRWNRYALYHVMGITGLAILQSVLGEGIRAARDRHCAVPERRSPLVAWLVRFVQIELLSVILTIAEVFLAATLGFFGM